MKVNIEMKDSYIQCDCGRDVEPYDHTVIDHDDIITINYCGWCPQCKKEYVWDSTYKFISGMILSISERKD